MKAYLKIARDAIKNHFSGETLNRGLLLEKFPELKEQGASFVTLTLNGQLRGCIGSIIAHRVLLDDIISNALSSAFKDPRFAPLSEDELEEIRVEVSILTPPQKLEYRDLNELKSKIQVGVDGVIIKKGYHQATFLPQVWEELSSFEIFFAHLGQKAGLARDYLNDFPEIHLYQVKKIKEE